MDALLNCNGAFKEVACAVIAAQSGADCRDINDTALVGAIPENC
jgi:hypothetical protein